MLENFEITFSLEPFDESYKGKNLLPSLLPVTPPEDFQQRWVPTLNPDIVETGRFYKFDFIPFGLFGRMMVRLLRTLPAEIYWRYGVLFKKDDKLILVQQFAQTNTIEVRARSSSKPGLIPREITESIENLVRNWYKISMQILIPCTHCLEAGLLPPYYFTLDLCESYAIQGKSFINCERDQISTPVRLDRIVPDLTLKEYEGVKIPYEELENLDLLGEGGAAKVFKARWKDQIVAVKQLILTEQSKAEDQEDQESFSQKFKEFRREVIIMR